MYYGDHMNTGGWIFMSIGMVILLVLLVALVWWIVSQQRKPEQSARPHMTARETLDHRLVNGDITSEQYDELRKKLDAPVPASG
jgi:uncharacterized membrane protein